MLERLSTKSWELHERSSPYKGALPADAVIVDCREAAAGAAAWNEPPPPPPDRRLTSEQLHKKLPWTRDPEKFALAVSQHAFPRPIAQTDARNLFSREAVSHVFSENAIDKWVETMTAKAKEIDVFLK